MLVPLSGGNLLQEAIRTFAQSGQRWSADKEFISSGAAQAQQCRSGFFPAVLPRFALRKKHGQNPVVPL